MTPREQLIGAASALDVTIANMIETVDEIRRVMGSTPFSEPATEEERASIMQAARSLLLRSRTALAWGADDAACSELADESRALIASAAAVVDQHRRATFVRFNGLRIVKGAIND